MSDDNRTAVLCAEVADMLDMPEEMRLARYGTDGQRLLIVETVYRLQRLLDA